MGFCLVHKTMQGSRQAVRCVRTLDAPLLTYAKFAPLKRYIFTSRVLSRYNGLGRYNSATNDYLKTIIYHALPFISVNTWRTHDYCKHTLLHCVSIDISTLIPTSDVETIGCVLSNTIGSARIATYGNGAFCYLLAVRG